MPCTLAWLLGVFLAANLVFHQTIAIDVGQLQVRINDDLAARQSRSVFGSIVKIRGLQDWGNDRIVHLAKVAHEESKRAHKSINFPVKYPGLTDKSPGGTTTLVVGDTAYISTSVGGGSYFYVHNGNTRGSRFTHFHPHHQCGVVTNALKACQEVSFDKSGHRTGASCGEPMAALAFCLTGSRDSLQDAKIVTVTGKTSEKIVPPCGRPGGSRDYAGEWGCDGFIKQLGLTVIPENTPAVPFRLSLHAIEVTYPRYP